MAAFSGYLGYGTAISGYTITEPADAGYARQAVVLSDMNPYAPSTTAASVLFGPSVAAWGTLSCVGLFDAVIAGNCIAFWPLKIGHIIGAGQAFSPETVAIHFANVDAILQAGYVTYQQGQRIGATESGAIVTAGVLVNLTVGS